MSTEKPDAAGLLVATTNVRFVAPAFSAAAGAEADVVFFPRRPADTEVLGALDELGWQYQATILNVPGGASQTVRLYGRTVEDGYVGPWILLGTSTDTSDVYTHVPLSDGVCGPNQFKLSREGGDATSRVGVTFS